MLLALSNGMRAGVRVALFGVASVTLTNIVLISAVAFGFGAVLTASETFFNIVRVLGVFYLCYIGWGLWRTKIEPLDAALSASPAALQPKEAFIKSASVAVSNPKALLFFSAFFPQFIHPAQPQAAQYLLLGSLFLGIDSLVMLLYILAGTRAVKLLSLRTQRAINRCCAGAMFFLAATIAVFRRTSV